MDPDAKKTMEIPEGLAGLRLDKALAELLPESSLRERRRLIEAGRVLVNGRPAPAALKVRPGQTLSLREPPAAPAAPEGLGVRVVVRTADYAVLAKPAGLHTAALAGGTEPCLEDLLPKILGPDYDPETRRSRLVNRLDRETSGLVAAAFTEAAALRYRALEDAGMVEKTYLALVQGRLEGALVLDWGLDTADRANTRVLEIEAEALRRTQVLPLEDRDGRTLVEARIKKGARHQIRAHLARAGHPIVGDGLYGEGAAADAKGLMLHHARLRMAGLAAEWLPDWA